MNCSQLILSIAFTVIMVTDVQAGTPAELIQALKSSAPVVYTANGSIAPDYIKVIRSWKKDYCEVRIVNTGSVSLRWVLLLTPKK